MSQCVPSWEVDDPPPPPPSALHTACVGDAGLCGEALGKEYEIAELTWKNSQLELHGLVPPRRSPVAAPAAGRAEWSKNHRSGTLESVVNQSAAGGGCRRALASHELADWYGGEPRHPPEAAVDAIVPCHDAVANSGGARKRARMMGVCSSQGSAVGSLATTLMMLDTWREEENEASPAATATTTAYTVTNSASPETENTSFGGKRKVLGVDDYVSISHTSSHTSSDTKHDSFYDEVQKTTKSEAEKASASTRKSRATAVHNQSERKRRDKINEKMKTLQKLVPNASKTDKASMLDEVIEYLKQLQAQIQMMSKVNMMMPTMAQAAAAMPQMQMPVMTTHVPQMPQMGMGLGLMDLASMSRPMPSPSFPLLHPSAFLPFMSAGGWDASGDHRRLAAVLPDPYTALLVCQMAQQQPMSLDEYSRMAALFQQFYQQQPPSNAKQTSCDKLFELDPEIERTFRALRIQERSSDISDSSSSDLEFHMAYNNRTMKELAAPDVAYKYSCINYPVLAGDFELRSGIIYLLPKFQGLSGKDPNRHLHEFHVVCSTMKPYGISEEDIKLRAFPFSLAGAAKDWLYLLPTGYITSWINMKRTFLEKFFPASRTTTIRENICSFQ